MLLALTQVEMAVRSEAQLRAGNRIDVWIDRPLAVTMTLAPADMSA